MMNNESTTSTPPALLESLELLIPPPLYALAGAAAMWLLHRYWPVAELLAPPWRSAGIVIMSVSLIPAMLAFGLFRRYHTSANPHHPEKARRLVTTGIYRWTRNPMYLSLLTLLLGWGVKLGSASALGVPLLFALTVTRLQIIPEERVLAAHFGETFHDYARRVRRWL